MSNFNYRRAIESLCFVFAPLLSLSQFVRAADQRDLVFFSLVKRGTWETLDREGLLPPVALLTEGHVAHGWEGEALREGHLRLRDEDDFEPWGEYEPLYSRWQLLTLGSISDGLQVAHPLDRIEHGLDAGVEFLRGFADGIASRRLFEHHVPGWRREELLLVRTQSLILPMVTGLYSGPAVVPELAGQDTYEWIREQQRSFDYDAAVAECGVDAEDLAQLYEGLSHVGRTLDPAEKWFPLVDQIKRDRIEELKGDALRAVDYYRAARVIRGWHARLRGTQPLPDVNEAFHGTEATQEWQKRLFGEGDIRGNRAALPGILEHFDLYPWRVQLLVEGPSEEEILKLLFEKYWGTSFARVGIHLISFGGSGIPKKTDMLLGAVRTYANYYYLLFDNEGTVARLVDELRRAGHIEQDPESHVWIRDLEADNFTIPEICREVRKFAKEEGVENFRITTAEVRKKFESSKKGLLKIVEEIARDRHLPLAGRAAKPKFARRLGRLALRKREMNGKPRPIFDVSEHLLRLARADRRVRGRLRAQRPGRVS